MSDHGRHERSGKTSSADLPALRDFLRGYFHEDCVDEYGSLEAAARQFCKDTDQDQHKAVAAEWGRFLEQMKDPSLEKINEALTELGSACTFASLEAIRRVTGALRD
jgi:CdiI immunity protein